MISDVAVNNKTGHQAGFVLLVLTLLDQAIKSSADPSERFEGLCVPRLFPEAILHAIHSPFKLAHFSPIDSRFTDLTITSFNFAISIPSCSISGLSSQGYVALFLFREIHAHSLYPHMFFFAS